MAPPPFVTVVVPTFQRRAQVRRLLLALCQQTVPAASFEVVVSIDGSTDGTREELDALATPYPLTLLSHPRRGRAAALNTGIAAARGTLIVLLDDDMQPAPEFLAAHMRAHERRPRTGVMGAAPMEVEPGASPATRYIAAKFNRHLLNLADPAYAFRLTDFYSGNFSIAREVLEEVGGFDEDFRVYGNEDLELSFRLAAAGVVFQYSAQAMALQHTDKGFSQLVADSVNEGRTAVLFALKHPDAFAQLKLGQLHTGPILLLAMRDRMLRLYRHWPALHGLLVGLERWLPQRHRPGGQRFYGLALGYFFWVGASAALQDHRSGGRDLGPLAGLARDLRL